MRKLVQASWVGGLSLALSATAWAAPSDAGASAGGDVSFGSEYVLSYFMVILCIAAGVAVACSPARRRDKAKPDDYAQKKLG